MVLQRQGLRLLMAVALAAALVFGGRSAQAQVTVTGFYSVSGSDVFYDLYVTNNGSSDLAVVTLTVPADPNFLLSSAVPSGFQINFDSSLGLLDLLEDSDPLTPEVFGPGTTIGAFHWTGTILSTEIPFEALDADLNSFTGDVTLTTAPEPGALALLGVGLSALGLFVRIRKGNP